MTLRQEAPQRGTTRVQVLHFGAVVGWLVETEGLRLLVSERQIEPVAVFDQVLLVEFLLRVRGHLALPR